MQPKRPAIEKENLSPQPLGNEPRFGFAYLLICLVASLLVPSYFEQVEQDGLVTLIIFSVILLSALYLVSGRRTTLIVGVSLALPALISLWLESPLSTSLWLYLANILYSIFLCYIVAQIVRYLLLAKKVDLDMILAAVCLYLIIGLIWALIYQLVELSHPGAFKLSEHIAAQAEAAHFMRSQFVYFSFVTLSTLGYGDITPLAPIARSWAVLESLTGQVYLAVVIARLVGLSITRR